MKANFELKGGDILHCSGNRLISRLIKRFTKSKFSHTAYVVEIWGKIYIIDSQRDGTNPRPLEAWLKKFQYDVIVARKPATPSERKVEYIRAFDKSGNTGYDLVTLFIRQPWKILTGKWAKWLEEKDPEEKMVCSEFVMWVKEVYGNERYTPQMAFDWTEANNYDHKIYVYSL